MKPPLKRFAWRVVLVSTLATMGCRQEVVEVNAAEFLRVFENRKPNEEYLFREDRSAFCYLECNRMGNTVSVFRKVVTLRTRIAELTADQAQMLRQKGVPGEWAKSFLKKRTTEPR